MANTLSSFDLLGNLSQQGASNTPNAVPSAESANAWGAGSITDVPDAVKDYEYDIQQAARKYGVDPQLVADYMTQESGGRNGQTSSAGAKGLMQFMDDTAKDMEVLDVWDAKQSIDGGAKYIALLQDRYGGDREKMAAGYNWGMGNVDKSVSTLGDEWKNNLPEETSDYLTSMAGRKSGGGLSEQLASQPAEGGGPSGPSGYAVPTDESLDEALNNSFASLRSNIKGNPTFGSLEWEQPSNGTTTGGDVTTTTSNSRYGETVASYELTQNIPTEESDYGWGIANAWKRGLIRAGQLVDLAQGDEEEYAEGQRELAKYEVSEEDAKRLEKLQETDGFWSAVGEYILNPALAMQVVVESLPMSAAPLAGGLVGGAVGNVPGAMLGAFAGSFGTEYLASIGEALSEHGVDATDPQKLKDAFADPEFMKTARAFAAKRGVGVAVFDSLSMGIAGRLYKPIKALAKASTKTGAVVGGTSELLAQGFAGAGGEMSGQTLAGQERNWADVAGEFVGEFVPGVAEIGINKITGKDAGGNAPEADTPGTTPAERDVPPPPPDGALPPVDTASLADLEAEMDDMPGTPPPESETATTSPTPTDEPAPKQAQEEASSEVVGETDIDDMLKAAADKEDAADAAAREADVVAPEDVTPLITPKDLAPKITKTINAVKEPKNNPVRIAWGGLMKALATRYPELDAKAPTGKFSGTGVARYLKKLQDQVDITKDLPELKEFLDVVTTGKTADVIQALDRLTSTVRASTPSLADAPINSVAGQVQAVYNDFMEYYTSHQRVSKAKKTKGQPAIKGPKIPFAQKLGDLANAVRDLLKAGYEAGVLEEAGIGADYGKTIEIAIEAADATMSPIEKKSGSGGKTETIAYNETTLLNLANNLKEIAEKVAPLLAEAERGGKQWKADAKAADIADGVDPTTGLTEETSAVTEEPAKPKKRTKAENVAKGMAEVPRLEEQREIDEQQAADEAYDKLPPKELGKLTGKKRAQKIALDKEQRAKIVKLIESDTDPVSLSRTITRYLRGVDINYATVTQLRKIAKTLGAEGYSKLTRAGVLRLVQEKAAQNVEESLAQGVAQEDAEIQAEVEKQVPEKFRTGHVFHTVRSWKDIASIIKSGLNKGTNLALDIMGQGVSMLGDNGTVVLVFADNKGSYTTKDYQNDGVVSEAGMKPVAIITDADNSTTWGKNTLKKLEGIGLPVYSNGKRVATVTTKTKKAAVTRKSMGKVSEGGMSDVFKTASEIATEEGIARDLNSLVKQAELVEMKGGVGSNYNADMESYDLSGVFTGGHVTKADMTNLKQPQLRKIAKAVGAKTASKKSDLIDNIFAAAEREVSRVEAETAATEAEKKAPKVTVKKPDIKGANPDEVFDVTPRPTVGAASRVAAELVGEEGKGALTRALDKVGMSKKGANILNGIKDALGGEKSPAFKKLISAITEFVDRAEGNPEAGLARLLAQVADVVEGKTIPPDVLEALTEYSLLLADAKANRPVSTEEAQDSLYDDRPDMTETERFIAEQTGAIAPRIDEDSTAVDEHNVPWSARLKKLFMPNGNMSPAGMARFRRDERVLTVAVGKAYEFIQSRTREVGPTGELGPKPPPLKMQELIDVMLSVMPSNHRYTYLFKLLKKTSLNPEVKLFDSQFGLNSIAGTSGLYRHGMDKYGMYDPKTSTIGLAYDPEYVPATRFVGVMLHEMVHAATAVRYITEKKFQKHINTLWEQAIEAYGKIDPNFDAEKILYSIEYAGNYQAATDTIIAYLKAQPKGTFVQYYGLANPLEFMAEGFTNPIFQEFLATTELTDSINFMTGTGRNGGVFRLGDTTNNFSHRFKSIFSSFLDATKKTLGMSLRNSVLEELLIVSAANFDTPISQGYAKGRFRVGDATPSREPNYGKYDGASMTALVNKALVLKRAAKKILKDVKADRNNRSAGMTPTEVNAAETKAGGAARQATLAIDMLTVGLEAADTGRRHVIQDHLERAEEYLSKVDPKFSPKVYGPLPSLSEETIPDKKVRTNVVNVVADAARGRDSFIRESVQNLAQKLIDLPKSINLGFMALDQIERNYRKLFARAATAAGQVTSPLTRYIVSKQIAMVSARAYAEAASKIFQRVQKIDGKARAEMWRIARESTLAQVWPHVSLKDKMNDHLWGKKHKTTGVRKISKKNGQAALQARKDFAALKEQSPDAAQIIIDLAQLTKKVQDHKRRKTLTLIAQTRDVKGALGEQLAAAETSEDLQKIFKQAYDEAGNVTPSNEYPADMIADKDNDSKEEKAKKVEARREFDNIRSIARSAEAILKNTTIRGPYFPLRRYGPIVVASSEKWNENNEPYVSFHNNKWEARRVQDKLKREFGMDTNIARKIESTALSADAKSVVAELKSKIKDTGGESGLHDRLDTAMLEILAESTAQQSALKRHGIDGVSSDDMGRAMEEYIQVSQYTIGDIETTWTMSEAFKDMRALQKAGPDMTPEEQDTIGLVINELAAQNKEDARDREMSPLQRTIGTIGFFNFLGAPSYWVLNATQTLTVTLPYIGAKWGAAKGSKAYKEAARTIAAAAKNAKSYDQFKANLPPAAQRVVQELEDRGILQSTIAHEFGDQLSPTTLTRMIDRTGVLGRATTTGLRLMEKIPETVEKYNRISTALAIYNLSGGNLTEVADGVQATQFNYDSVNRARLLKSAPKWAGGGLRALITPIMMFKTYGIGLTRLFYGNAIRSVMGDTKAERNEARKIVGGLIASHTVFGGVAGGIMLGPIQVIIDVANAVFSEVGDEFDPEEALEMYLQDVANDTIAALATRGVPAALGFELSKSINLGNLLWMGNDRINFADAGGVETGIVTALGPVAQYGVTSVREGMRVWNDDPRANWYDFAAAAIPLKMARGAIRGAKYEFEGVGTDTVTWMKPEKVAGWIRMTAGFRPTKIAMLTDREYNAIGRDARRSARKSQLISAALKANSPGERAKVWKEIQSFNHSLDKRGDWINKGDIASLRSRRRTMQRKWDRERGGEYR